MKKNPKEENLERRENVRIDHTSALKIEDQKTKKITMPECLIIVKPGCISSQIVSWK